MDIKLQTQTYKAAVFAMVVLEIECNRKNNEMISSEYMMRIVQGLNSVDNKAVRMTATIIVTSDHIRAGTLLYFNWCLIAVKQSIEAGTAHKFEKNTEINKFECILLLPFGLAF